VETLEKKIIENWIIVKKTMKRNKKKRSNRIFLRKVEEKN
jgi:hypothetical protein